MSDIEHAADELEVDTTHDLPPFGALVAGLADITTSPEARGDGSAAELADLEEIMLTLAIELEVRDADRDAPRVTGSTPTQWTETTVLPAFHRLTMRIARYDDA